MKGLKSILEELPPSRGKKGWPWSLPEGIPSPERQAEVVTVVTPSYNQGQFLEETIRSVLLQDYPGVEYMIFDGGSSDGSLEIIKAYSKWLAYWESAPDKGQADAISRGWKRASGSILAYLNSDDLYMPGAIARIEGFLQSPAGRTLPGKDRREIRANLHFLALHWTTPSHPYSKCSSMQSQGVP